MRQRCKSLHYLLELCISHLAQENGEKHGNWHENVIEQLQPEGVAKYSEEIVSHNRIPEQH